MTDEESPRLKTFDVTDIEVAAEESEQDRRDHRELARQVNLLMQNEDAVRVPTAVRRLIDGGVDPVVVAKTLLIGNRDGGTVYELSARAVALAQEEAAAELWMQLAIREMNVDLAAYFLIAGAVWLMTQFSIDRAMLVELVKNAARRPRHPERAGYGAVDLVDSHGVGNRAGIITCINLAKLPDFAPLVWSPHEAKH